MLLDLFQTLGFGHCPNFKPSKSAKSPNLLKNLNPPKTLQGKVDESVKCQGWKVWCGGRRLKGEVGKSATYMDERKGMACKNKTTSSLSLAG